MKKFKNVALALVAALAFVFAGCKKAAELPEEDTRAPGKVENVNVSAVNGTALLTWTNPSDTDFYATRITVDPGLENGNSSLVIEGKAGEKSSASFEGLVNGTEYTFKLYSLDDSHNACEAVEKKATPSDESDKKAPADVTGLSVLANDGKADLSWTNPADEDFAGVKISMSPAEGTLANPVTLDKGVSTFTVTGLTNGTEYTFTVQTFDTSLNYSEGSEEKGTPQDTSDKEAPADVTNLSVSCINGKDGKVNAVLSWTDPSDDDLFGMEVTYEEKTSGRAVIAPMAQGSIFVAPGNGGLVITDLTAGTSYTFTVKAMDTSGNKSAGKSKTETMTLKQLSELKITLTASTTTITNQDVIVTVKAESSSMVSKICYVKGLKSSVDDVLEESEITSASSFAAAENGTYTVAALDYDGRREISYITINNIDKIVPNEVTNLTASYDYAKKTINVTWDSSDSDIDYYLVSYTKDGSPVVTEEKVWEKSFAVTGVSDRNEYVFTVAAVDKAENESHNSTARVTTNNFPIISKVELSKTRFAYTEGGSTFTASVYGSNFDLISMIEDKSLYVQIVDSNNDITDFEATVDAESNKASATLTLPTLTSATVEGTDYTVRVKVCGSIDEEHTASFNISDAAKITSLSLEADQITIKEAGMKVKASVEGTDLDVAGKIELALYDSNGEKYGDSVTVDTTEFTQSTASFDVDIPLPSAAGTYTVKVLFDGTAQSNTASLQVYEGPSFTSFKIPKVGSKNAGSNVTATVTGKNFMAAGITSSDFVVICDTKSITENSEITISSDTELTVTLTIPENSGSYDVTIVGGGNSMSATFAVSDTKNASIGDIILKDGTRVAVADVSSYTIDESNKPVAVIAYFNYNGVAIGLGLQRSETYLRWAESDTTGYTTSFTDIIGTCSGSGKTGYLLSGDLDGSDNWEYICSIDKEGTDTAEEIATNYPAFNFAVNYGTTTCGFDANDELASGWYIPSIAELQKVHINRNAIQTSLTKAEGFTLVFGTTYTAYWSSSQYPDPYDGAWMIRFYNPSSYDYTYYNGYSLNYNSKSIKNYVLVVRQF